MFQQRISIILASKSPRRQELLTAMNVKFTLLLRDVDESYPEQLQPSEIAMFIAEKKAKAFAAESLSNLVITADTIVAFDNEILGKPNDAGHAREMLSKLGGQKHQVYTGVSINFNQKIHTFCDMTEVFFRELSPAQIDFYIQHYNPFDKAGSYGVQDWIGMIAVEKIVGSYTNVMGLPTEKLYRALCAY
jgi:septum formation protein